MYLYPDNLTARPMLWLWALRDVALIGVGALLSALALTQAGLVVPLVATAVYAFLAIRHDGVSMLDPLTGKSWMLGSSMKIRVAAADVALGRIDFEYMVE